MPDDDDGLPASSWQGWEQGQGQGRGPDGTHSPGQAVSTMVKIRDDDAEGADKHATGCSQQRKDRHAWQQDAG